MSTLGLLKSRISDDLARDDLSTQIGQAIEDAIEHYRCRRFFFNETRSATFTTASGQAVYSVGDDDDIPLFFDLDDMFLTDSSQTYRLKVDDPHRLELLSDSSSASGRPYRYAWFDQSIRLYPIPDGAYTVRPVGAIEKASPAGDNETGNVWMVSAFELLRCRAKAYLYAHVIKNIEMAGVCQSAEAQAIGALRGATNKRTTTGRITASQF